MNTLSAIYASGLKGFGLLAADKPTAPPNVEPSTPIFGSDGYITPLTGTLLLVMIGLIVFYFIYKKKQQQQG